MRIFRDPEAGGEGADAVALEQLSRLRAKLADVGGVVAIGSARGGVGKSTITVNVAAALALAGRKVGIIDADLNSPSITAMLGMKPARRITGTEEIEPGAGPLGLRIAASNLLSAGEPPPMSFLDSAEPLPISDNGHGAAELEYTATMRRLIGETRFGALDLLFIDVAPGLEALYRVFRAVGRARVVIISHPSELSARASKAAIELASHSACGVVGVVENMAGFNCDGCHSARPLMPQGTLGLIARETGVALLERLPFDPRLAETCDRGLLFVREYAETPLAKQLTALAHTLDRSVAAPQHNESIA